MSNSSVITATESLKSEESQTCKCCDQQTFTADEKAIYDVCKSKGRRGIVTSLCVDQSISYVRILQTNDQWMVFKYVQAIGSPKASNRKTLS